MPAKMPFRTFLAAILAAGGAAFMAEAQGRVGLQPASVELELDPGQPMRQIVTIANLDPAKHAYEMEKFLRLGRPPAGLEPSWNLPAPFADDPCCGAVHSLLSRRCRRHHTR